MKVSIWWVVLVALWPFIAAGAAVVFGKVASKIEGRMVVG